MHGASTNSNLNDLLLNLPGMVYRCRNERGWSFLFAGEGCRELTGHAAAELVSGTYNYADLIHPDDRERVWNQVQAAVKAGRRFAVIYRIVSADGVEKLVWEQGGLIDDPGAGASVLEGFITDISSLSTSGLLQEHGRQHARIQRLNRLYEMLTAVNEMLVRAEDEETLFRLACELVVDKGGFSVALIGRHGEDVPGFRTDAVSVREDVIAQAGSADPGLGSLLTAICPLLTIETIEKGRWNVCTNILENNSYAAWHSDAKKYKLHSEASFPLFCREKVAGVLCVFSAESWHFEEDEVKLLSQLAGDISYALNVLARERERAVVERTLEENEVRYHGLFEQSSDAVFLVARDSGRIIECNLAACRLYGYERRELMALADTDISIDPDGTRKIADRGQAFVPLSWHKRKNGERFPVEIKQSFFEWQGSPVYIATVRDIAERIQREEQQRRQYDFLKGILNALPFRVCIIDKDYRVLYANPAMQADLGMHTAGQRCYDYYHGRSSPCPWCKNDEVFSGNVVNWEWQNHVTGLTYAVFEMPFTAMDGIPAKIEILQDITHQKQLQKELLQAQKMESVGRLAGGIAHDFNNLLQAIIGFGEMVREELEADDPRRGDMDQILHAADRAATLTRQILLFSRRQIAEFVVINVNEAILNLVKIIGRVLGEGIRLDSRLDADLPAVKGDSGQIEQVLLNLAINARDAMPNGGDLLISTMSLNLSAVEAAAMPEARPGKFVCISVKDTGSGIPSSAIERIFEPFFTTKSAGQGSGMGLAVVYGIVKEHNGWISVLSEEEQGTVFNVFLPVLSEADGGSGDGSGSAEAKLAPARGRGQRIMVVEDQDSISAVLKRVLPSYGYRVFFARDAQEGRHVFKQFEGAFDMLLIDVVLPDGNGVDLAVELMQNNNGIKVLLTSGYMDDKARLPEIRRRNWNFIEKPYEMSRLLTVIDQIFAAE